MQIFHVFEENDQYMQILFHVKKNKFNSFFMLSLINEFNLFLFGDIFEFFVSFYFKYKLISMFARATSSEISIYLAVSLLAIAFRITLMHR